MKINISFRSLVRRWWLCHHKLVVRAIFTEVSEILLVLITTLYTIGLRNSRHFFSQPGVKTKLIESRSHSFSRAPRQLYVFTSSFDWFTRLSVSFVIG